MKAARIALAGLAISLLQGCSSWFRSDPEGDMVDVVDIAEARDTRVLIPRIAALRLDPIPGGAILVATGLAPTQGWYDGTLAPANRGEAVGGILTFEFRAMAPADGAPVGTERSREVVVGHYITDIRLAATRQIAVVGEANTGTIRP